jgi:hypothetical protein
MHQNRKIGGIKKLPGYDEAPLCAPRSASRSARPKSKRSKSCLPSVQNSAVSTRSNRESHSSHKSAKRPKTAASKVKLVRPQSSFGKQIASYSDESFSQDPVSEFYSNDDFESATSIANSNLKEGRSLSVEQFVTKSLSPIPNHSKEDIESDTNGADSSTPTEIKSKTNGEEVSHTLDGSNSLKRAKVSIKDDGVQTSLCNVVEASTTFSIDNFMGDAVQTQEKIGKLHQNQSEYVQSESKATQLSSGNKDQPLKSGEEPAKVSKLLPSEERYSYIPDSIV